MAVDTALATADSILHTALEHHQAGRLSQAATLYREILRSDPQHTDALHLLGAIAYQTGNRETAVELYRKALAVKPDYADAYNNLGVALKDQGKSAEAASCYQTALVFKPGFAEAYNNLGIVLRELGKPEDAAICYRRALSHRPDYAAAHFNLGMALQDQGRLEDALACYHMAIAHQKDYAQAYHNLGSILHDQSKLDEAAVYYRKAIELKPDYAGAYSNLLFLSAYYGLFDPQAYLSLVREWESACVPAEERQAALARNFLRMPVKGRRLKVGYVSGDFRRHAVSCFIEQVFASHDKARIELFAYTTNDSCDEVTKRLQSLVEHWTPLTADTDAGARARIEADGIDVLVDLSGPMQHHRLGIFARRAAPVQAHYLGYCASTGLTEMDYWIGDEIITPPESDAHFSERVWRLPRIWVSYAGRTDVPASGWRPPEDGAVWLGSFNNLCKLTPQTLALWARLLHALPEARLLLKAYQLADSSARRRIETAMAQHGIAPERMTLQDSNGTPDWLSHMACYNRLDIALDPVGGVGGGTTSCDALWMAVPVVTLEGDRMGGRMTAAMLRSIGRGEWIARSEADYIDKVVALARNVELRKELRKTQRDSMAQSRLCDAQDLARNLENAYFEMFEKWYSASAH